MSGMAEVIIFGRVGRDPEIKTLQGGGRVANFSVATDRGKKSQTDWHRIACWDCMADLVAKHVKKGDQVLVVGDLTYHEWERDGVKRMSADIICKNIQFAGRARGGHTEDTPSDPSECLPIGADEDVPF